MSRKHEKNVKRELLNPFQIFIGRNKQFQNPLQYPYYRQIFQNKILAVFRR